MSGSGEKPKRKKPANFISRPRTSASPLLPRQQKFVTEYIKDFHLAKSAIRAGYSPNQASAAAFRLLKDPRIVSAIEEQKEAAAKRSEVTVDWVVNQYRKLASADIRGLYHADGRMKLPHELDDDTAYAMAGIEVESIIKKTGDGEAPFELRTVKARRWDPVRSLDSLAKHLKMFGDTPQEADGPKVVRVVGGLPEDKE